MTMLTIDDLFTPTTSGVGPTAASTPTVGSWYAQLLSTCQTLGLPTTAWQPGTPERTMLAVTAVSLSQEDGIISMMAQGGFLDFAATGSVTYTGVNNITVTQPVTPDPSDSSQNPTGAPGWLDVLGQSVYDTTRISATYAQNSLYLANTSANTYSLPTKTFHVANPLTNAGYTNDAAVVIPGASSIATVTGASGTPIVITTAAPHGLTTGNVVFVAGVLGNTAANGFFAVQVTSGTSFVLTGAATNATYISGGTVYSTVQASFSADVSGPSASSAPYSITQVVTPESGVSVANLSSFVGNLAESNVNYAARCRLRLATLSPSGPHGAYEYFAKAAVDILATYVPPVVINAITRAVVKADPITGTVNLIIANATGAVHGVANLPIQGATNASPVVVQANAHGLLTNDTVTISGITGNTTANGTFQITVTDANHFSLNGSAGNGAYTGGGNAEGSDLGEVDRVVQANAVPDSVTLSTQSATAFPVTIVAVVNVPVAYVAAYTSAVQLAISAYFAMLPIGGISSLLQFNDVVGVLYAAGIFTTTPHSVVVSIPSLTLNGGTVDLPYSGTNAVATLAVTPAITVNGV